MFFILSPGRTGSTLLGQLITRQTRKDKNLWTPDEILYNNNWQKDSVLTQDLRSKYYIFHSHYHESYKQAEQDDIIYFSFRNNLVETIASHYIAEKLNKYHWQENDNADNTLQNIKVPVDRINGYLNLTNDFCKSYQTAKQKYSQVYAVFYEQWIDDYSQIPAIDINIDFNGWFVPVKVDKQQALDYNWLHDAVKKANNGSIYLKLD